MEITIHKCVTENFDVNGRDRFGVSYHFDAPEGDCVHHRDRRGPVVADTTYEGGFIVDVRDGSRLVDGTIGDEPGTVKLLRSPDGELETADDVWERRGTWAKPWAAVLAAPEAAVLPEDVDIDEDD